LAESIKNVKKKCLGGIKEDSAGQAVYEKSLQIIKSVREFLAQSVGSKNVSLQNIAMNFCGCWSFSLEKIPIGGLKNPCMPREKLAQVFYWHPICALTA